MEWGAKILREKRSDIVALVLFAVLVLLMTYPQALHLADGARDWGDPLLNTWIMWWEVDAVAGGNLAGFFDANIFFPHARTLAYSEFLVPQTIVAAPLLILFDNPLIAYNVVLLLSFLATAFAMYLLGKYLTGSPFAAFVGGVAMAFSPFMFSHLSHIQVIGAAGIPLAFLFLHRYFDDGSLSTLLCFSAAYVGQALANAYFAVYLTYAAGAYIAYRAIRDRRLADGKLYAHLTVHAAVSLAVLLPFFGQYFLLRQELGFVRSMDFAAEWYSFFAAPPINRLYGTLTAGLRESERTLFPGLGVLSLAVVGLATAGNPLRRARRRDEQPAPAIGRRPGPVVSWTYRALGAVIVVGWLGVLVITFTGGITTSIGGVTVRANDFDNPLAGIVAAVAARAWLRHRYDGLRQDAPLLREPQRFYAGLLFASFLLTLGATGPYRLLYDHAPGFDGIRAMARIHIINVFCLAVFVAFGTRVIVQRLTRLRLAGAAVLLPLVMLVEFFSAPLPLHEVAWGDEMPEVYRWLSLQEGDFAAIELPLEERLEFDRVLYSTVHEKQLVNGTSGYASPVYTEMQWRSRDFPSRALIDDIEALGVRWIIVHRDRYGNEWDAIALRLPRLADVLRPVAEIGSALVLETRDGPWLTRQEVLAAAAPEVDLSEALLNDGWTAVASVNQELAAFALDGDPQTRWHSAPQSPGDVFTVDLGRPRRFDTVRTRLQASRHDYPRGWRVEVSDDGLDWTTIAHDPATRPPITDFVASGATHFDMPLPEVETRYLRIVQTGSDERFVWSIHELELRRHPGS